MIESPNPYERNGKWYFHDETYDEYGPFPNSQRALRELMSYCYWLDHGPTLWQRVWWPLQRHWPEIVTLTFLIIIALFILSGNAP